MGKRPSPPSETDLASVPVFPLPDLVVFPGAEVPLHFFEPRYRALAEDAVATNGLFATVQLEPGWQNDYYGRPRFRDVGTLGRIIAHRNRPDGTLDVVFRGLARGRLEELVPSERGYRLARVQPLADVGIDRVAASSLATLRAVAQSLAAIVRKRHPDFSLGIEHLRSPADLVDALAHRVVTTPEERQRLLETLDVRVRIARLVELVGDILLQFGARNETKN